MRKKLSFCLILFLVLAVAGIAAASQPCCSQKHGERKICLVKCGAGNLPCPKMVLRAKAELKLTDNQLTKIKALTIASKKEKIRIKADIKILGIEIAELLEKKEVDKAAVDAKVDEIARLAAQCTKRCIQTKLKTKALLTDEQLKKIESLGLGCAAVGPVDAAEKPKCPKSK